MTIPALTRRIVDYSDKTGYEFGFVCDKCGFEWRSERLTFAYGELVEIRNDEAWELLWNDEHRSAYNRAMLSAIVQFNQCPDCGMWVCDDCFHVTEEEDTDVCKDCIEEKTIKK